MDSHVLSTNKPNRTSTSIVMPVYNQERFVAKSIESVLYQDYSDWELLIVDDGSTDQTVAYITPFLSDERIILISQQNQGVSAARNRGLSKAQGQYVAFLDADDYWSPGWLTTALTLLEEDQTADGVVGSWQYVGEDGLPLSRSPIFIKPENLQAQSLVLGNPISPSSVVLRTRCIDRTEGFDPTVAIGEDWLLWLQILMHGGKLIPLSTPLGNVRLHDSNSMKKLERVRQDLPRVVQRVFNDNTALLTGDGQLIAQAYSLVYFHSCRLALRLLERQVAIEDFRRSVAYVPHILEDISTWYSIACSHQSPGCEGTANNFCTTNAQADVLTMLDAVYITAPLPSKEVCSRSTAKALAYVSLGRLIYALEVDYARARFFLLMALLQNPATALAYKAGSYLCRACLKPLIPQKWRQNDNSTPRERHTK